MYFDWHQWSSTTDILTVFLESSNNTGNSNIHIGNPQSHIFLFWAWWLQRFLNPLCQVKDTLRISTGTSYSIPSYQILSPAMHRLLLKASFWAYLIRSCPIDPDSYFCLPVCLYWLSVPSGVWIFSSRTPNQHTPKFLIWFLTGWDNCPGYLSVISWLTLQPFSVM